MPVRRIRLDAGKPSSFTKSGPTGGNMIRKYLLSKHCRTLQ